MRGRDCKKDFSKDLFSKKEAEPFSLLEMWAANSENFKRKQSFI